MEYFHENSNSFAMCLPGKYIIARKLETIFVSLPPKHPLPSKATHPTQNTSQNSQLQYQTFEKFQVSRTFRVSRTPALEPSAEWLTYFTRLLRQLHSKKNSKPFSNSYFASWQSEKFVQSLKQVQIFFTG